MSILATIVDHKRLEIRDRKIRNTIVSLEKSPFFSSRCVSMTEYLVREDKTGIIAEFKRKSPSKGIINSDASVARTTAGYVTAGASGLSILTDVEFFGGADADLVTARISNSCPILRKDFTVDEYQIIEAKSLGADVILLIAAILDPSTCKALTNFARSLGLQVLLEVHDEQELKSFLDSDPDMIGVNNRNLKTFEVSLSVSKELSTLIPKEKIAISESGISSPEDIVELQECGFRGFLMGESFMKHAHPEIAAMDFMNSLRKLKVSKQL